jgi:hypothetical protein
MADPKKETPDERRRRTTEAYDSTRTGNDPSFVAVNTLPTKEATPTERITPGITGEDRARSRAETGHSPAGEEKPPTGRIGEQPQAAKEDVGEKAGPGRAEDERRGMVLPPRTTTGPERDVDWDQIQHPGECGPSCDTDYGTRPVSELTPPPVVQDKADLAAVRMMSRDKEERERLERQRIAATGITTAAASQAGKTRTGTDDRSMTQKVKDEAYGAKEKTKETARDVKEDVDRRI